MELPAGQDWSAARRQKMERLRPRLRHDLVWEESDGKANYLTDELKSLARIADTENVSSNGYDDEMIRIVARHRDGLILDCGAGNRPTYLPNVVNFEIVDYPSTDVLGVGEVLPFLDDSFDAVFSVAVLEHVRDPFKCAREIGRVLKPGGELYCCVPFLQPLHGYPHHYFNATSQGIRVLFEDFLDVEDVRVIFSTHPIWSLTWILDRWLAGLPEDTRQSFSEMRIGDLLGDPMAYLDRDFCSKLSQEARFQLASANVLTAVKPPRLPRNSSQ